MKARLPNLHLGKEMQKAIQDEVDRQIDERLEQKLTKHYNDLDAMTLYTLHEEFGFGVKRLRRFYEAVLRMHKQVSSFYEMDGDDFFFVCKSKLKEIGVDIDAWNEETEKGANQ